MPLTAQATAIAPTSADNLPKLDTMKAARRTASKPGRVTGKLAIALKRIIELGEELDVAAKSAGLTTHGLRLALSRPHVIAWMRAERDVFRAYVCAQNIHHAKELRDSSGNGMVRLGAIKMLEQISDNAPAGGGSANQRAGMVIVVVGAENKGVTIEQSLNQPMQTLQSLTNTQESTPLRGERSRVGPHDDDE